MNSSIYLNMLEANVRPSAPQLGLSQNWVMKRAFISTKSSNLKKNGWKMKESRIWDETQLNPVKILQQDLNGAFPPKQFQCYCDLSVKFSTTFILLFNHWLQRKYQVRAAKTSGPKTLLGQIQKPVTSEARGLLYHPKHHDCYCLNNGRSVLS